MPFITALQSFSSGRVLTQRLYLGSHSKSHLIIDLIKNRGQKTSLYPRFESLTNFKFQNGVYVDYFRLLLESKGHLNLMTNDMIDERMKISYQFGYIEKLSHQENLVINYVNVTDLRFGTTQSCVFVKNDRRYSYGMFNIFNSELQFNNNYKITNKKTLEYPYHISQNGECFFPHEFDF